MKAERLIGREVEFDLLRGFLRLPGHGLVFRGEPGIGKTALWLNGVAIARDAGYRVLACRPAETETGFAFAGLIDLLAAPVDELGGCIPEVQRRALESALLLGEQTEVDARLVSIAALNAMRLLASSGPLLLAIDDLQWLDSPSARVLAYALRRLDGEPVSIVAATRAKGSIPSGLAEALARRDATYVDLAPLPIAPLRQLVRARFDGALSQAALSRVARVSGCNPLHAIELARWVAEQPSDSGAHALDHESLPATLTRRLARLPAATRTAVLSIYALAHPTASLIGQGLDGALKAGVAERDDENIRLAHPLLGSILYGALTAEERRALHARLARLPLTQEERARHLALSTEDISATVASELDRAATAARGRGAVDAAAELGELALRLTPPSDTDCASLRMLTLALDEYRAGDATRARERWQTLLREQPTGPVRARAAWHLLEFYGATSMSGYESLIRTGLAGAGNDAELRGRVHTSAAAIWLWGGSLHRARRHLRRGLPLVEAAGDKVLTGYALAISAQERFLAGAETNPHAFDDALAVACGVESVPLDLDPRLQSAFRQVTAGDDLVATREELMQLRRVVRESGEDAALPLLHAFLAETEALAGNADQVECNVAEAERWAEFAGTHNRRGQILYLQALAHTLRGELERARELVVEALEFDDARSILLRTAPNRALLGTISHLLGRDVEAVELFERARRELDAGGYREPALYRFTPSNVAALVAVGEPEHAMALTSQWAASARRAGRASALAGIHECEAILFDARGEMDDASEAYGRARLAYERLGYSFDAARVVLALGHTARRNRKKSDAASAFREAASLFDSLGAGGWARRARHELDRIALGRRRPSLLTESERRIAMLVVSGRRNREIADALVVSQKTVEVHLTHVYKKLGITSRSQLVARVAAQPELVSAA